MPSQDANYRFGPFELRWRSRELYKKGTRIKLRPQPFQILHALVERKGDVVTRDEHTVTVSGAPGWEYTETLQEVAMDKPRHPQVIRPWKTQQTQKNKWNSPPTREPRRERGKKLHSPRPG